MSLPTVKQLRYFVALEEKQHFGKAAEACFVSQSAFSVAIRELESLLEVRLVDRTNRKVTVTELGREVATQARLCIRDIESVVEMARGQREALAGALRLGVIPTIAPFLLPRVLAGLRKAYPNLQLLLREETTPRIYESLMNGQLDLILLALPYDMRNVEVMRLFRDRFRLACRAGTKLVDPENYRFNRLDAESVLLLDDGHCLRDHAISACRIRNLDKVSRFSASSLLTLVEMVDADLGISYLPEMAEGSSILSGTRVKTYPMRDRAYREIGLAWRKGGGRDREFRLLGEFIRAHGQGGS
jgi:LysR family transcriptional regulator, hydrogen peroxide-inducible genes activator